MGKNNKGGRSAEQQAILQRYIDGLEVKEAENAIRIVTRPVDWERAVPGDPKDCGLARVCQRTFGGEAIFFRTVAYVQIPDEVGVLHWERFMIPRGPAQDAIRNWDLDNEGTSDAGFVLRPPKSSETAEAQRLASQKHREAELSGEFVNRSKAAKKAKANRTVKKGDMTLRDGTGLAQFHDSKDEELVSA